MEVIKCVCGKQDCKIQLSFEDSEHLLFTDERGESHLMYLDIDTLKAIRLRVGYLEYWYANASWAEKNR